MLDKIKSVFIIIPLLSFFSFPNFVVNADPIGDKDKELKAKKAYQIGSYRQAESIWSSLLKQKHLETKKKAEIYTNLAALYRLNSQPRKAISTWQEAISIYRREQDQQSQYLLAAVLVDQAQAHNSLHQTDLSLPLLQEANKIAEEGNKTEIKAVGYQASGNAHTILGKTEPAAWNYNQSLVAAEELGNKELIVVALNNLSNLYNKKYQKLLGQAQSAEESGSIDTDDFFFRSWVDG